MNLSVAVQNKNTNKNPVHTNKIRFKANRDIPIYLLLSPALILLLVFHYIPIYGISMAFETFSPYKGILGSKWVGLKNFEYFLVDSNFWRVMRNTLVINFYTLILGFPAPLILALLLNEVTKKVYKRVVQTISYLPYFISWVVVSGIIFNILSPQNGVVNVVLHNVFGTQPIHFLGKQEYFRSIIVISGIWKSIGMSSVYYLASLTSIDPQLYEAAKIDGANRWKQTLHVTLPGILPITVVLFILQIGHMVSIGFDQIFLLYNPVVYDVGDVISTYTYRLGLEQMQYSLTTAIGLTQSVVNFILVFSANKLSKKFAGFSMW